MPIGADVVSTMRVSGMRARGFRVRRSADAGARRRSEARRRHGKPSRKSCRRAAGRRVMAGDCGRASVHTVIWRMPRKRSPPARISAAAPARRGCPASQCRRARQCRADSGLAVGAARAHGGDAVDEFCLADGGASPRGRSRGAWSGPARTRSRELWRCWCRRAGRRAGAPAGRSHR